MKKKKKKRMKQWKYTLMPRVKSSEINLNILLLKMLLWFRSDTVYSKNKVKVLVNMQSYRCIRAAKTSNNATENTCVPTVF